MAVSEFMAAAVVKPNCRRHDRRGGSQKGTYTQQWKKENEFCDCVCKAASDKQFVRPAHTKISPHLKSKSLPIAKSCMCNFD